MRCKPPSKTFLDVTGREFRITQNFFAVCRFSKCRPLRSLVLRPFEYTSKKILRHRLLPEDPCRPDAHSKRESYRQFVAIWDVPVTAEGAGRWSPTPATAQRGPGSFDEQARGVVPLPMRRFRSKPPIDSGIMSPVYSARTGPEAGYSSTERTLFGLVAQFRPAVSSQTFGLSP